MDADDYLERMRKQLKGFSTQEQDDLLDELASHIESGQEDNAMDANRLIKELDSPEQVGRNLRNVHQPNRWIDLLLILIPYFVVSPLIQLVLLLIYGSDIERNGVQDPLLYLGTRIATLIFIGLALIGRQRRSPVLMLFWALDAFGSLISLMVRESRFIPGTEKIPGGAVESIILYLVMASILVWIFHTLKQTHFHPLLVVFTLLPLVTLGLRLVAIQLFYQDGALNYNSVFQYSYQIIWIASIALFILFRQPDVRWFGLLLHSLNYVFINLMLYPAKLPVALIYSILPVIVLLAWALDFRGRIRLSQQIE